MANAYFKSNCTNNNWNDAANWWIDVLCTVAKGTVPVGGVAGDDVIFNTLATSCDINHITACVCKSINLTGYGSVTPAVLTFKTDCGLTVSGDVTLEETGVTYIAEATTLGLIINAAATITSDGVSFSVPLAFGT